MPLPADSIRIAHTFTLNNGEEEGVFTLGGYREHNVGNQTDNVTEMQILADKLVAKFRDAFGPVQSRFPNTLRWDLLKVYALNVDGTANAIGVAPIRTATGAVFGGNSAEPSLPLEVACAVTLFGYDPARFTPDARRRRGRFYLPPLTAAQVTAGGIWPAATVTALEGFVRALLEGYDGTSVSASEIPGADELRLAVLSPTGAIRSRLHSFLVGNVPDVQRRRRRSQPEARVPRPLNL